MNALLAFPRTMLAMPKMWQAWIGLMLLSLIILGVLLVDVVIDSWDVITGDLGAFLNGTLRSRSIDPKLGVHQGLVGSFWIAIFVGLAGGRKQSEQRDDRERALHGPQL